MSRIPVIVEREHGPREDATLRGGLLTPDFHLKELDIEKIRESLSSLSGQISEVLQDIKSVGSFKLKEVQVSVEISVSGGVALIGTASAGVKGAVSLMFSL